MTTTTRHLRLRLSPPSLISSVAHLRRNHLRRNYLCRNYLRRNHLRGNHLRHLSVIELHHFSPQEKSIEIFSSSKVVTVLDHKYGIDQVLYTGKTDEWSQRYVNESDEHSAHHEFDKMLLRRNKLRQKQILNSNA